LKLQIASPPKTPLYASIKVTGSKSESNRLLLLQALYPTIEIRNLSNSDDAEVMQKGLAVSKGEVDIHHAGTAMRFLTAYFAASEGKEVTLTGSKRMKERPIAVLVDALRQLGARITYVQNEGYPPIQITGANLTKNEVRLPANISSQYISALLLVAPKLANGITLELIGNITSIPYIKMTLALLNQIGVTTSFVANTITVQPQKAVSSNTLTVESDWSSVSYFYSIVALSPIGTEIKLSSYKESSLQGDSVLTEIYKAFGVRTTYGSNQITLHKLAEANTAIEVDLTHAPDIAQTIAVSCFGLGMSCHLTGLHTLKIKETDRLEALKAELSKLGASIAVTDRTLTLEAATDNIEDNVAIETYNDHRMAMAFAPLGLKTNLIINEAEVVSKSYPDFWKDLKALQFHIQEIS